MKFDVRQRLLVVALLPAALLAGVLAVYFIHAGVSALDSELRQRGEAMVRHLAPASEYGVLSGQMDLLQTQVQVAARQSAVKAVLVLGRDGRILAVSGRVSLSADDLRRPLDEPGWWHRASTGSVLAHPSCAVLPRLMACSIRSPPL